MRLGGAARLFAGNAIWRLTGLGPAGRALVRALGADDEDIRAMAGMMLVRSGERALPLLREALASRRHLPPVLTILGDVGGPALEPEIARFRDDPDPLVASAAREALRVLAARPRR